MTTNELDTSTILNKFSLKFFDNIEEEQFYTAKKIKLIDLFKAILISFTLYTTFLISFQLVINPMN